LVDYFDAPKEDKIAILDVVLPSFCKDKRGVEIPARRFTAMTDLETVLTTALHKTGDGTSFASLRLVLRGIFEAMAEMDSF